MELLKLDNFPIDSTRVFGGATGSKFCIIINGVPYMMKGQQNLKLKQYKNVVISYANDPISEYIGSHIYEYFKIPVHNTLLGMYRDRLMVCCKDISVNGSFIEFKYLRNTIMNSEFNVDTSGMSINLEDIFAIIENSNAPINQKEVKERFWLMFIVDAIIGNSDRNNGNWGFYKDGDTLKLLPVYDNGGCLNNKKSDDQLKDILDANIASSALNYTTNFKIKGKLVNPLHYINGNLQNDYIRKALRHILSFEYQPINNIIDSLKPVISDIRAIYYKSIIKYRFGYLQSIIQQDYRLLIEVFCNKHNIALGRSELRFRDIYNVTKGYDKDFYAWLTNGNGIVS